METYAIDQLSFFYPEESEPALSDVSFRVKPGEFVTLCGPSGGGKTTLLRLLKSALSPHGRMEGEISFEGKPLSAVNFRTQSERIGFVLQSPENQIVTDKVWHELAFGLESLGADQETIRLRVAEMAAFFGIQRWFHKNVSELSGGQKQLLNLAAVMTVQPTALLLDEPTSQLDPIAAEDFLAALGKVNRELGVTVILCEHRLEEALPLSDRVLVLEGGRLVADGNPRQAARRLQEQNSPMFWSMPTPVRVFSAVDEGDDCPLTVREGREWLDGFAAAHTMKPIPDEPEPADRPAAVEFREVFFRYDKEGPDVLRGLSFVAREGELTALVGGNGAGKSTALMLIAGLRQPQRGKVLLNGQGPVGMLPQNPQALFVKPTVKEDLWEIARELSREEAEKKERVSRLAAFCGLTPLLDRHPYDLSGGEQQRAALCKVLLLEPKILLLDEPTKGMDAGFKRRFAGLLGELKRGGTTILMVSHDVEFCAETADRCVMLFDGQTAGQGRPRDFFSGNRFYTTAANRMARERLPRAITAGDLIRACGGAEPKPPDEPLKREPGPKSAPEREPKPAGPPKRKLPRQTLCAILMVLLAVPLTIYVGVRFLDDRKYYFISLLVLLETMLPFVLSFEGRKPQPRELITIAVLCAIGVAGRIAFFMLPQFKPVAAIVILTGACFGAEAGFLTGAVTALCSNLFFQQGPWTPWQMAAFGLIGFLAGLLFHKGPLPPKRFLLCLFGGLSVFFLYGGIMNPASVILYQANPTWPMFALAYVQGIPFDLIHAAGTVFFLWVLSRSMLQKLERIKVKYGMITG